MGSGNYKPSLRTHKQGDTQIATKTQAKAGARITGDANDTVVNNAEDLQIGKIQAATLEAIDPMADLKVVFVPNQEGFMPGDILAGKFLGTKVVRSTIAKKPNWLKDADGVHCYRNIQRFEAANGLRYGIFGVGTLDYTLAIIPKGTQLQIEYVGQAEKAFKSGQSPAHMFKFYGPKGLELTDRDLAQTAVAAMPSASA